MKNIVVAFFSLLGLLVISSGCEENEVAKEGCSVPAIIHDLRGLDGCGFVFELQDGTKLEPYFEPICGTPPLPGGYKENPLYNFELVDGKRVMISYKLIFTAQISICMAGQMAKITCISEIPSTPVD